MLWFPSKNTVSVCVCVCVCKQLIQYLWLQLNKHIMYWGFVCFGFFGWEGGGGGGGGGGEGGLFNCYIYKNIYIIVISLFII